MALAFVRNRWPFLPLVAALLPGCSSSAGSSPDAADASEADARSCPSQLPSGSDCATTAPRYEGVIAPLLAARCGECHSPSGVESVTLFDTIARIKADSMQVHIFTQIYQCLMPPAAAPPLTSEERETLLQWFVCDAPAGAADAGAATD
jgi:uncharacterized membrane protein